MKIIRRLDWTVFITRSVFAVLSAVAFEVGPALGQTAVAGAANAAAGGQQTPGNPRTLALKAYFRRKL
jgi:hypothetical protein